MKKILLIIFWVSYSFFFLFMDNPHQEFVALRLNLWIQMSVVAFVLAGTGSILQNILKNPIADPWILGVTGASSVGTVVVGLIQLSPIIFWRTTGSLIGSGLAIFLLMFIAQKSRTFNVSKFILIGIGINSFCSALIVFLQSLIAPNDFFASLVRISGHFVQRSSGELILIFLVMILLAFFLHYRHKELAILNTGDELAAAVGISVHKIKSESLIVCTVALAVVISLSGNIAFIGLAAPHIIRMVFGEKEVLSPDILFAVSGILMLTAALLIRMLPDGVFVPIGSAMSLLGAPLFIYILISQSQEF